MHASTARLAVFARPLPDTAAATNTCIAHRADELQLTVQTRPCAWSSPVLAAQQADGVTTQAYPDWSYCRMPRNLPAVLASGADSVAFEAGSVLRCGCGMQAVLAGFACADSRSVCELGKPQQLQHARLCLRRLDTAPAARRCPRCYCCIALHTMLLPCTLCCCPARRAAVGTARCGAGWWSITRAATGCSSLQATSTTRQLTACSEVVAYVCAHSSGAGSGGGWGAACKLDRQHVQPPTCWRVHRRTHHTQPSLLHATSCLKPFKLRICMLCTI